MCIGCCRYMIDHKIKEIPLIGEWLVERYNCETGGFVYRIFAFIFQNEVKKCEQQWGEFFEEENNKCTCPDSNLGQKHLENCPTYICKNCRGDLRIVNPTNLCQHF